MSFRLGVGAEQTRTGACRTHRGWSRSSDRSVANRPPRRHGPPRMRYRPGPIPRWVPTSPGTTDPPPRPSAAGSGPAAPCVPNSKIVGASRKIPFWVIRWGARGRVVLLLEDQPLPQRWRRARRRPRARTRPPNVPREGLLPFEVGREAVRGVTRGQRATRHVVGEPFAALAAERLLRTRSSSDPSGLPPRIGPVGGVGSPPVQNRHTPVPAQPKHRPRSPRSVPPPLGRSSMLPTTWPVGRMPDLEVAVDHRGLASSSERWPRARPGTR